MDIGISDADLAKVGYVVQSKKPGDGKTFPSKGSKIRMAYKGFLIDGTAFDSSDNFECEIGVGGVIQGWDKGVLEMSQGQEARLICHYSHGYGEQGDPSPPPIPPRATLIFDVKLLRVLTKAQGPPPPQASPSPAGRAGQPRLQHQRYSVLSEEALAKLAASQGDIGILEEQVAEALKMLQGGDLDRIAFSQLKTRVSQLEAEANKIMCHKVDDVQTSELSSGKAEAKDQKKQQIARLDVLFERIEEFFAQAKEKDKTIP